MTTENENLDRQGQSQDNTPYNTQEQNNNGNIGREVDEEPNGTSGLFDLDSNVEEDVDVSGTDENQRGNWSEEIKPSTANEVEMPLSEMEESKKDQSNIGTNAENFGGTAAED